MVALTPRIKNVSSIKSLILNPALTSHFQAVIGVPFNNDNFAGFCQMLVLHIFQSRKVKSFLL